jgi:uncharacterized protein (TIGR02246 family)
MKPMRHLLLISVLALAASTAAAGQEARMSADGGPQAAGVAEEILRLEREYDQAYARHDAEQFERIHTDDFMMTARGRAVTRAELLARLRDPGARLDKIESVTAADVRVRAYGDTVVTTGRWKRASKSADGKDTSAQGFFTRVWVRRDGRWLLAVAHYSPDASVAKRP